MHARSLIPALLRKRDGETPAVTVGGLSHTFERGK